MRFFILVTLIISSTFLMQCSSGDANSKTTDTAGKTVSDSGRQKGGRNGSPGHHSGAVPVEVTPLTRGVISSYLQYSSTLQTEQIVDIYSRIAGLVEAIYVEEGDRVSRGQRLLQIEKDEYELAEERARLEYFHQQAEYNRLKQLQVEELLSKEELERAEFSLKQAEIDWKQAALNLRHTTVTSPISGVVGERRVNLGDRVQTSTNLFQIANLDEKIIHIYVPQDEFSRVYKKQPATITTDMLPGEKFRGFVKRISPIIDPESGTFKVTVALEDPEYRLNPGIFVNIELIVATHENTLLIPKAALIYENERTYFFIVQNDTSRKVELERGYEDAEKVEVLNDLEPDTKVVVLGQNGLKDGTRVNIIVEKNYAWQPRKPSAAATRRKGRIIRG